MIALFAALIVPWFVNWNDYRGSFEAEASRILGHRVHVEGNAHATILPSPSLTFTKVAVDDQDGQRIMDVARFDVVIELMPLLQGKVRVISMTLDKPVVNVAVDAAGGISWLKRAKLNEPFNPDNVILDNITITDGALNYDNKRTGVALSFGGISAQVSATALLGPWHVDGFYLDNGNQVGFRFSTGRVLDDGTLRVKADVNPPRWPVTVSADGPVGIDPTGDLTWHGIYSVSEVSTGGDSRGANTGGDTTANGQAAAGGAGTGWRSEGAFTLTSNKLDISKAILSNGPVDRPLSVAGTLAINFGRSPSFAATAQARQIDLDRTLGKGPAQPVEVAAAANSLLAWLGQIPIPEEPGQIRLDVPAVVVGGRIIEDVSFALAPAGSGWQINSLKARLPGQATLDVSGLMTTQKKLGFIGQAHLAVDQPATFATWWRGKSEEGGGRLLAPFDLSGHVDIAPGRISVDKIAARVADANITGRFGWTEQPKGNRRNLSADLDATRIDFVQVKALAELLVGHNLNNTGALASDYSIQLKADAFAYEDLTIKGIDINAEYSKGALTVTALQIDDIGGVKIEGTNGEIDNLSGDPHGHLVTTVDAVKLAGLARLADHFLPGSGLARWLDAAAPALGEAQMSAKIVAPLPDGRSGFALTVENGVAASTTVEHLSAAFTGGFANWRTKPADIAAKLYSPDSTELARQFGLAAVTLTKDESGSLDVQAKGIPAEGLDTVVLAELAGLNATVRGRLTVADDLAQSFVGTVDASSDDIRPVASMAGLDLPGGTSATALWLDKAQLRVSGQGIDVAWKNGKIGPAVAGGDVTLAAESNGGWRIGGNVTADEVNLGWIASLGLGFAPLPTADSAQAWSHTPFSGPGFGAVSGTLQVNAGRLDVSTLGVTAAAFALTLQPQRVDVNLTAGQIAAGTVTGGMSINNVAGNVTLSGRFDLKGAALESFVWKRDGRSVATGTLDLSANFESTGNTPAGLVSTMTGGGAITVRDGLARYVNPNTVRLLVRASDLGQQFSEDALRAAFSERIDADNLPLKDASGAFAIVAGAVRLKNLIVKSDGVTANGNAVIDFNAMTLDSDWNLAFDPVDDKVKGADPEAGIVFSGPIAAPTRTVDVLPFAAYLNERQAARMTEIIALDAATREEKQRLTRLADKLKSDAAQRAVDARIAAQKEAERRAAAAAQAARLEAFHENREILVEQRHVKALAALADRLAAQQADAGAKAAAAEQTAKAARSGADAAAAALADARAVEQDASAKAEAASAALAKAKADADAATQNASQLFAAADQANQALSAAARGETEAKATADAAAKAKTAAEKQSKAAAAKAATALNVANKAAADASDAAAAKAAAEKAAADAVKARDAAQAELAKAETAVKDAQTLADAATARANDLGGKDNEAEAAKAKADNEAKAAADTLASATTARDDAAAKLDKAKRDAALAAKVADAAASMADMSKNAADLAKSLAGDGADAATVANATSLQNAADSAAQQAAAKKAAADAATAAVNNAQAALDQAADNVMAAEKAVASANGAAAQADAAAKAAAAAAGDAANTRDAALSQLDVTTKARDVAKAALDQKDAAVTKTAGELDAATKAVADANNAADKAAGEAKSAQAAKTNAEQVANDSAAKADETAKAVQAATGRRVAAAADAKAAAAKAATARKASAAAEKTFEAKASANDDAQAALQSATADRQQAETAAGVAEAQARTAEAAAKSAAAEASTAAAAAGAARQTADQAAAAAPDPGTIDIIPPVTDAGAATVTVDPTADTSAPVPPKTAVPEPRPSPRSVPPVPTVPSTMPLNAPLVITPPY